MRKATDWRFVLSWAAAYFLLQVAATLIGNHQGYGYFIDELYYVACARRLDFGYVDHPPLAPALLWLDLGLFGSSIAAIRLPSALAGAATVALVGWLTGRVGGGRFAIAIASVAFFAAPSFLVLFNFFSMNGIEILLWTAALVVVVELVERRDPKLWVAFGVVSGLALENKHTVVTLAAAIVVGLLLTNERRLVLSPWLLVGGGVAFALFLPNLLWQIQNGFPSLEFYRNATLLKNLSSSPARIFWTQALFMNPLTLPLWLAGLYFCARERPRLRFVALTYAVLLGLLVVSQSSRPDRMAGLYPVLFAFGAVEVERRMSSPVLRGSLLVAMTLGALTLLPVSLPVLPPETTGRYMGFLGLDVQIERGEGKRAELPQWLADRIGWEKLVRDVRRVYESLPEEEKRGATILAPSYGQAGAIELFGGDLPPVLSPHNTYFLWGRERTARLAAGVAIAIGFGDDDLRALYGRVDRAATHQCGYCMTWRNDMPLFIAREPKLTPAELRISWEAAKHYE